MKKITFIINGRHIPYHWAQHAAIIINELETDDAYLLSYIPDNMKKMGSAMIPIMPDTDRLQETCERTTIVLYCKDPEKTLDEFKILYNQNFLARRFNLFTHNCTDAVNLALDYFFPEARNVGKFCCLYDSLICLLYLGTIGLKCFTPSCLSTPIRTYEQVKQLERIYGKSEAERVKDVELGVSPLLV